MLDERSVFTVAELGHDRNRVAKEKCWLTLSKRNAGTSRVSDDDAIVPSDLRLTDDSRADSGKGVNLINGDHRVIKHVASTAGSTELGKRRQAELGNAAAAMQARCGHDQRQRMIQQHVS